MFLFLAEVAGAVFRCLTVPPPPARGATALLGERPAAPTDVELGAAGYQQIYHTLILSQLKNYYDS